MKWKFWETGEKEKLKRMTIEEIDELLTARQNEYQYKIDLKNAAEAEKYFEDIYNTITTGEFMIDEQHRIIKIVCKYRTPKNVVIAKLVENKLLDVGYVISDVNANQVWALKLKKDVGDEFHRFFDNSYVWRSLHMNY